MSSRKRDRFTGSLMEKPSLEHGPVATIALLRPVDKPYSYRVPAELAAAVKPGARVRVPFGRSGVPADAICIAVSEGAWETSLRPILSVDESCDPIPERLLELGQWVSRYYAAPLGRTLDLLVPRAARRKAGFRKVRYVQWVDTAAHEEAHPDKADQRGDCTSKRTSGEESQQSTIANDQSKPGCVGPVNDERATHAKKRRPSGFAEKTARIVSVLANAGGRMEIAALCTAAACSAATVQTLARRGRVTIEVEREPLEASAPVVERHEPDFSLNADQQAAVDAIESAIGRGGFSVQVLFGVTGSGKTEVYVTAIRRVIASGRQAIFLVPEIALTTQTIVRLAARFDRVATLHSGLSDVERSRAWSAIARGEVDVVIGTRSAVFAPCPSLGLIVVDEEAEPSYKSQASPRYHARDVAVRRASLEGIVCVLGSATPSLETWQNLKTRPHYKLLRLPRRVGDLPMPQVHLVDMHEEHHARGGVHLLSREMEARLAATLNQGQQAVILLNRRGYASYLHCPKCRYVATCPRCSVRMVFHQTTGQVHCHYCLNRVNPPVQCPMSNCDGRMVRFGLGTQRVEEELARKFPATRVRRMDSDVMQRAADYAEVLSAFERREFDVLVGTQMIAKGLDFPFVSFVGVVSADTALAQNDFRAEERTFQLVLQVAGRSGRGFAGGHVVVQTFAKDNESVQHAVRGDYEAFAERELASRRRNHLPPATRMVRIVLADRQASKLSKESIAMADRLRAILAKRNLGGTVQPAREASIARLRDQYRYEIVMIFSGGDAVLAAMDAFRAEGALRSAIQSVVVDVDPVSLQ
ncbi:MAG: primosomal protein N' [Phycisphaerae bacterium]|nr:MAG: primosomal protein N' [Planctomycetia bacterium]GJQ27262.1 MAG: primosomal protein N' [Phycisphaerae bacterium]